MSNSLATRAFIDGLSEAILAAWPTVKKIYIGAPQEPSVFSSLPYATITWQNATMAFVASSRTGSVEQTYMFDIEGVFANPGDAASEVDLESSDRADELIAAVQTGPTFATYGYLPLVSQVAPQGVFGDMEEAYGVSISFTVKATADHS